MGSPCCGKTTTAEAVGHQLGAPVIDVDDYLESFWKTSVAAKVDSSQLYTCSSVFNCLVNLPLYGIFFNFSK